VPPRGDPKKHFTIPANGIVVYRSEQEFLAAVAQHKKDAGRFKDHAFVFVHGTGTTFEYALYRTAQIAFDLGENGKPFGTAFLYSWPSLGSLEGYKYDFDSARLAVDHLTTFLRTVVEKTDTKHVHLIAHSMGNWPAMAALEQILKSGRARQRLSQVILAAPDVDAAEFTKMAAKVLPSAKGLTLYVSSSDGAMIAARKVHRDAYRAGDISPTGPVILKGVDTIDVSLVSTEVFTLAHSEYAERRELLNDIALIFRKGERPPNLRTPILQTVGAQGKQYWRFPAN
jgi:esterase/lipase superfamily enzyme